MMTNDEIAARLHALAEPEYREFSRRLLDMRDDLLGVRLPAMHKIAKELARGDWRTYLDHARGDSFEEVMIQGMTLAHAKATLAEKRPYIVRFIKKIDNWSVCDCFCTTIKPGEGERAELLELIDGLIVSPEVYKARVGVVLLLTKCMGADELDGSLERLTSVRAKGYYADMAVAWALSIAYRADGTKTLDFMRAHPFSAEVTQKAIQKMIELSNRTTEEKAMLRGLKRTMPTA